MNRSQISPVQVSQGVPHMRGDEPLSVVYGLGLDRVPHMRGDEPLPVRLSVPFPQCSPHAWG